MSDEKTTDKVGFKIMTEEGGLHETAKKQAQDIAKMYEDRDRKAVAAKEHLVSQLHVTTDKYRTANGVMAALQVVRDVIGKTTDYVEEISIAKAAATHMAAVAAKMADKAASLDPEEMEELCNGFYSTDFSEGAGSALEMIDELLALQLCQNVGPSAEDIVDFLAHADEEIEKSRDSLREFCSKNDIDFNELCGPHDNCPDCLCMDCQKDCKEGKLIKEGQSAYDVCEDFVKQE